MALVYIVCSFDTFHQQHSVDYFENQLCIVLFSGEHVWQSFGVM